MKRKILLVDVDSKIPNLVLMKLSAYYKERGFEVTLKRLGLNYYKDKGKIIIDAGDYEKVFVSVIFTTNKESFKIINCEEVIIGGTGHNLTTELEPTIEHYKEDYSIYPETGISYGFITRGCIRNCPFCFVPKKEGTIYKYDEVERIARTKKVKFLDNNILAYNKCEEEFEKIIKLKLKCQFNQALDIRLLTERTAELLSKINYLGEYLFAFDNIEDLDVIDKNLILFKKYVPGDWKCKFFIYCNVNMNISDVLFRIEWCRKNKVLPYLMRDLNCYSSKNRDFYIDLAAYCNQPAIFKKMTFNEFIAKRTNNITRQKKSSRLYNQNDPLYPSRR